MHNNCVTIPTEKSLAGVVEQLKEIGMFLSAFDGSNIPARPPVSNHTNYYNHKGRYIISHFFTSSLVDHDYLFCDVMVGWPGSVHDICVLVNSQQPIKKSYH